MESQIAERTRRIGWRIAGSMLLLVPLLVLLLFSGKSAPMYRPCGHRRDLVSRWLGTRIRPWMPFQDKLIGFVTKHGCEAEKCVGFLTSLRFAQRDYLNQNGLCCTSVSALLPAGVALPSVQGKPIQIFITSNGTNWSAYLPNQLGLPGSYLTDDQAIHFSEAGPPTTNDRPLLFFVNAR